MPISLVTKLAVQSVRFSSESRIADKYQKLGGEGSSAPWIVRKPASGILSTAPASLTTRAASKLSPSTEPFIRNGFNSADWASAYPAPNRDAHSRRSGPVQSLQRQHRINLLDAMGRRFRNLWCHPSEVGVTRMGRLSPLAIQSQTRPGRLTALDNSIIFRMVDRSTGQLQPVRMPSTATFGTNGKAWAGRPHTSAIRRATKSIFPRAGGRTPFRTVAFTGGRDSGQPTCEALPSSTQAYIALERPTGTKDRTPMSRTQS